MDLKKTALYSTHIDLGGKMVEFAGYLMPVRYSGLIEEHLNVRNSVGIFDVSHMGEFILKGSGAINLLKKISSNDPDRLEVGEAQYSCMPNYSGGLIDDFLIYRLAIDEYLLVVNASNITKDWQWIERHNDFGADMTDLSDDLSLIAVQGPKSAELLQQITEIDLKSIKYYSFTRGEIGGCNNVIISATGYTGSGGFELYVPNSDAAKLWEAIFSIKSPIEVKPAGLGARDTLRLEMGFCLYGNDIDDTTSPLEAGLGWITKMNHDFVNIEGLRDQKEKGIFRKLVGFKLDEKGVPRHGYEIKSLDGHTIGSVTSGTMSPCLGWGIGLGYIDVPYHKPGTEIKIQIRKKEINGHISRLPFYKKDND